MKKNNTITVVASLCMMSMAQAATLKGKIIRDGEAVTKIKLAIPSLNKKATTNDDGSFKFENIDYGKYILDIEGVKGAHFNTKITFKEDQPINIKLASLDYEEVVVTANPLEHNTLKMTTPVAVLSEEDLILNRSLSLEQTLNTIPGVNSGSFGAGAGQIVIRGQQGPRVTILNNNITLQDASSVSPDHTITTEPLLAKKIEVLKGPATLLYGGGAIGGVINVIDNTIPTQTIEGIEGALELRASDSALKERAQVLSLQAGINDNLMTSFSYFNLDTSDYKIPGGAESEILHEFEEHEEEHGDDDHGDDDDDDHGDEHDDEVIGLLENSSVESKGYNIGLSLVNDSGFWGLSYSDMSRNYGIPGHEHHEEEHHDEDEDDDDHDGDDDHDHEEEEVVRIDMTKSVFNLKGQHEFTNSEFFNLLKTHYSQTDYQHKELEGDEIGTVFDNQANEFRFELTHKNHGGFSGVWGIQASNREFSAAGEEAFILPSDTNILSLFMIEEKEFDTWHGEFGLRYDKQTISTELYNDFNANAFSVSLGATLNLSDNWVMPLNWASAQRLATAEELFSNQSGASELIPHLSTGAIEIGNLELDSETSNNLDIGLKYRNNNIKFNVAAFYNKIDDFIYLSNTGEEVEEVQVFEYLQQDATFKGFEADIGYEHTTQSGYILNYTLFADSTRASLSNGQNVPRVPANRIGVDFGFLKGDWAFNMDFVHVSQQNTVAETELPTKGYDSVNLNINRAFSAENFDTLVFLKVSNLLDEEIREHASFIKDIAPRPGRSVTAGLRITF